MVQVLERSKRVGVDQIMITSGTLDDVHGSLKLIEDHWNCGIKLSTTVGVHPTRCLELERDPSMLGRLLGLLKDHGQHVLAIGEFGLDYDRLQFCPRDIQLKYSPSEMNTNSNWATLGGLRGNLSWSMAQGGLYFCI
jgi:TatD DNase family protein